MKKMFLLLLVVLSLSITANTTRKYGNYTDNQIFDRSDDKSIGLIFFPDSELLYDFDTDKPLEKIQGNGVKFNSSTEFYMSRPNSLKWNSKVGDELVFQVGVNLKATPEYNNANHLSLGIFLTDLIDDLPAFKIQCLGRNDVIVFETEFTLCRAGWNLFCQKIPNVFVRKIKITQIQGANKELFLDNLLIAHNVGAVGSNYNSKSDKLLFAKEIVDKKYPTKELTTEEIEAFKVIEERIMEPIKKRQISDDQMKKHRDYYNSWNIEVKGDFANGEFPLSYSRKVADTNSQLGKNTYMYRRNETLCATLKLIALDYAAATGAQKEELGVYIVGLTKLALTYGLMPNPWYNGRGFAEGVFFGREALDKAGILDQIVAQLFEQYSINLILFNEHNIANNITKNNNGTEFAWQSTADHLNTNNKSTLLLLLIANSSAEKARNLYRFASYLDNISLIYAPYKQGTFKPDGSMFHHWGNRFDYYAWAAGFRGATEYVYWLSQTPFSVSETTHKRVHDIAKIRFKVVAEDGYAGGVDNIYKLDGVGYKNLAMAGSVDKKDKIDSLMASYYLASNTSDNFAKFLANEEHESAKFTNNNVTLSYASKNIHTQLPWKIYTHGLSKDFYNTEYIRNGWLFYNIGALSMYRADKLTGISKQYGANLTNRDQANNKNVVDGYNLSLATGVTSKPTAFSNLNQTNYQFGTSNFVGGLSTTNGLGIFTQQFDSSSSDKYKKSFANNFKFNKSYFYFGNKIAALASDISFNNSADSLESGVFQEPATNSKNILKFNNLDGSKDINQTISTNVINWFYNGDTNLGFYFADNQNLQLFRGEQSFGNSKGNIVNVYLKHDSKRDFYEWIMLLNITLEETQNFAKNPEIKVLRRDKQAHIAKDNRLNAIGYVIFDYKDLKLPSKQHLQKVNRNCVIMLQEREDKITLAIADPNMNFDYQAKAGSQWSLGSQAEIVLDGLYKLENDNEEVGLTYVNSNTKITFNLKDGLTQEIILKK